MKNLFNQAFGSNEIPDYSPNDLLEGTTQNVLIDLNGHREHFRVGWYDLIDQKWCFHCDDISMLEPGHMRWMYLPLARNDK